MPPCQRGDCRIGDISGSGIQGFTGDRSVPRMKYTLHLESWWYSHSAGCYCLLYQGSLCWKVGMVLPVMCWERLGRGLLWNTRGPLILQSLSERRLAESTLEGYVAAIFDHHIPIRGRNISSQPFLSLCPVWGWSSVPQSSYFSCHVFSEDDCWTTCFVCASFLR